MCVCVGVCVCVCVKDRGAENDANIERKESSTNLYSIQIVQSSHSSNTYMGKNHHHCLSLFISNEPNLRAPDPKLGISLHVDFLLPLTIAEYEKVYEKDERGLSYGSSSKDCARLSDIMGF